MFKSMYLKKFALCLFVMLAALYACQLHGFAQQQTQARRAAPQKSLAPPKSGTQKQTYVAGELLVQFADAQTMRAARALNARTGATVLREFAEFGHWQHVRLLKGVSVEAALNRYRALPGVVSAQPNFVYHLTDTTPNDPNF